MSDEPPAVTKYKTSFQIDLKNKWKKALEEKNSRESKGLPVISKLKANAEAKAEKQETRLLKKHLLEPTRAYLQSREDDLGLADNLNKTKVVNVSGPLSDQPGFYCKVCDVILKSSEAYLDHINGRRHQKLCGFSLRVQRSTLEEVQGRFLKLKEKGQNSTEYNFEEEINKLEAEKAKRKEEKKEKKKRQREEESDNAEIPAEMKDMGFDFASFGSKKK
ncbi:hypothetical protein ROZALSC1DRAFT_26708 [Rozella allomycis CSF55]|uniref:U1-type domain-containing protein n=1 Tax=Rozella allomycis (strain CSF55) TaxID=988480 RepID=A0A075AQX2_ROZAC|nr:hypothetical protein O9G_001460 [Rozella allomycis CSF55]RKP21913.1 hypothetical protein ROZALSC1DRAFT_26708 [Rozella allomycis CSF55]|eukprot:EPZ30987.1 hypothetical protein O9G_001460 [Rozella allomycis CSF55]